MNIGNPLQLLEDFPIEDTKVMIKNLKADLDQVASDPDYNGEADILLCTLASIEKEIGQAKSIQSLSKEKQARVLADMCLLMQFLQATEGDAGDDFEDEIDLEDEE